MQMHLLNLLYEKCLIYLHAVIFENDSDLIAICLKETNYGIVICAFINTHAHIMRASFRVYLSNCFYANIIADVT